MHEGGGKWVGSNKLVELKKIIMMLLWTFVCKYLFESFFSFLLDINLQEQLSSPMVILCLTL